jgi:hypothetical protein
LALTDLEVKRQKWINKNDILNQQFIALLIELTDVYPIFYEVVYNFINCSNNPVIRLLYNSVFDTSPEQGQVEESKEN